KTVSVRVGRTGPGRDRGPGGRVFGKHDVDFAVGLVLHHDEGRSDLPVGPEFELGAGEQRVFELDLAQGIAYRGAVGGSGLLDGRGEHAHAVVRRGGVPRIGVATGELLVVVIELLHLFVGQLARPPDAGENVIGAFAEGLARVPFRAAGAVAHELVVHAALQ